jgi:tRNA threonylcarbamoyladenosine biosynthesis protein TsaB
MAAGKDMTSHEWLLAIDSSTAEAGVALTDGERWAELNWTAGRDQTVSLLDQIDRLLTLMDVGIDDLAVVAVATGPGMFSGLRVGLSAAKGLVLGKNLPLIGVSTLEATALPFAVARVPIVASVAAGRGRLVWAVFHAAEAGDLAVIAHPRNGTAEELADDLQRWPEGAVVTGELTPSQVTVVQSASAALIPAEGVRRRRAAAVAALALGRFARREFDDAVTLEPMYLHARSGA